MLTLDACQAWLLQHSTAQASLDRFKAIINNIKGLHKKPKVITVAGTNGKGSTILCLESILRAAGHRVATYTSPHLISLNERCRFDGKPVEARLFMQAFTAVQDLYNDKPTHWFEFLTVVHYWLCQQQALDYMLVEVGVGGKQCVTNCIEPDISVITTIALDHTHCLGNTREAIAMQKAGIFRAAKPAICGELDPPENLVRLAKESLVCQFFQQGKDFTYALSAESWCWTGWGQTYQNLPLVNIALQNAATALAALQFCEVDAAAIKLGLQQLQVPGRQQCLQTKPQLMVDTAHNPAACAYFANLCQQETFTHTYAIVTMKAEKDVQLSLSAFTTLLTHLFVYAMPGEDDFVTQAMSYAAAAKMPLTVCSTAEQALKKASAIATDDDRILAFGSFQLVGALLRQFS
jgi:dihydrofolate synthase/folylpolyglutamate synthase